MKYSMIETILVTGATGTVGSEVVNQLSKEDKKGINIRAAFHSQNKVDNLKQVVGNERIQFVGLDYSDPKTVHEAFTNIDKIFLLTIPSPNSVDIASNVIKEAKKNGIKHIVKLSVMNADAQPGYAMGRLHRQEEKIIEESGIPYLFRPTSFMQNFVNFFGQTIGSQNIFYFHGGDIKISFIDARDIAAVAVKTLLDFEEGPNNYSNKSYNITGQESLSYSQAAEILSQELGRRISYIDISEEDARKGMVQSGMSNWLIDIIIDGLNYIIRGDYGSQTSPVFEQITGQKPISFDQFVRDHSRYFK
jgi:uncharacterized protein YbjT (DUF2867 family)